MPRIYRWEVTYFSRDLNIGIGYKFCVENEATQHFSTMSS